MLCKLSKVLCAIYYKISISYSLDIEINKNVLLDKNLFSVDLGQISMLWIVIIGKSNWHLNRQKAAGIVTQKSAQAFTLEEFQLILIMLRKVLIMEISAASYLYFIPKIKTVNLIICNYFF